MEEIYHGGTTVTIHIDNSRGGQISCASMVLSVNGWKKYLYEDQVTRDTK